MRPKWSRTWSTASVTDAGELTSQANAAWAFPSSCARSTAASSDKSRIATRAPLRAKADAIAAPIPDAPPVTTAVLPASEKSRSTWGSVIESVLMVMLLSDGQRSAVGSYSAMASTFAADADVGSNW